jgi:Fe2+ or Zn2+ uptake regulation protein
MQRVNRLLNKDVWDTVCDDPSCGDFSVELKSEIRKAILRIAYDFLESLDPKMSLSDITLTGSMANYNYTDQSDLDLHILFDFSSMGESGELIRDLFDAKRRIWNDTHDIKIKDHDVELYAQDKAEPHHSTGVFSVLRNKWLVVPHRANPEIDEEYVLKKSQDIMDRIDYLSGLEEKRRSLEVTKNKIMKMRKSGLERKGEFDEENLIFKTLRNTGYIEKLNDVIRNEYDRSVSLDQ